MARQIMDNAFYKHYRLIPNSAWFWKNFTPKEIACKGTGELVVNFEAMDALQEFRNRVNVPVKINSAYRSQSHNKKIGGAKNSYHTKGMAFDIALTNSLSREKIVDIARKSGFKGIGHYNNFVHIDIGEPRIWDFRK